MPCSADMGEPHAGPAYGACAKAVCFPRDKGGPGANCLEWCVQVLGTSLGTPTAVEELSCEKLDNIWGKMCACKFREEVEGSCGRDMTIIADKTG